MDSDGAVVAVSCFTNLRLLRLLSEAALQNWLKFLFKAQYFLLPGASRDSTRTCAMPFCWPLYLKVKRNDESSSIQSCVTSCWITCGALHRSSEWNSEMLVRGSRVWLYHTWWWPRRCFCPQEGFERWAKSHHWQQRDVQSDLRCRPKTLSGHPMLWCNDPARVAGAWTEMAFLFGRSMARALQTSWGWASWNPFGWCARASPKWEHARSSSQSRSQGYDRDDQGEAHFHLRILRGRRNDLILTFDHSWPFLTHFAHDSMNLISRSVSWLWGFWSQ